MRYSPACVVFIALLFVLSASAVSAQEASTSSLMDATSTVQEPARATPTRSFLQMADGNWYDPVSGLTGSSQQELLWRVYPELAPPPSPVVENPSVLSSTTLPFVLPTDDFPLIKAIRRGKELLQSTISLTSVSSEPDWYEVDLAVWNSVRDDIRRVTIRKKGLELKVMSPFDEEIRVSLSARMQSQYKITAPVGTSLVVAVKYPLYEPVKKGKVTTYLREEVVYTPYSLALQTPEMTKWGKEYLDTTLKDIYQELETQKIESAAYPDRLLSEVIHPNLPKAVMLIEQSDARTLEDKPQDALQRFYTVIAANEDRSYAYLASPMGASGAAQFMPSTYQLLARQDDFALMKDFTQGTRSLRNSMKAEVIYLDRILGTMPDTIQTKHVTNPEQVQEYLVAAYNGGEGRVRNAIAQYGDSWFEDRFKNLSGLKKKASSLDVQIASSKKKVKTLKGEALTKEKKTLASLQSQRNTLSVQIEGLNKGALRPETLEYLVKYRNAMESLMQETSVPTQSASIER